MGFELVGDVFVGLVDRIGSEEQVQVGPVDHAVIGQRLEVDDFGQMMTAAAASAIICLKSFSPICPLSNRPDSPRPAPTRADPKP